MLLVLVLTGCSSLSGQLVNRVACTAAADKLLYVSFYGPIGVASVVDEKDAKVICGAVPQ